jgi:hypothetical protein
VTKRESGVSSGIFVRRNYRAAKKVTVSIATKTNFVVISITEKAAKCRNGS